MDTKPSTTTSSSEVRPWNDERLSPAERYRAAMRYTEEETEKMEREMLAQMRARSAQRRQQQQNEETK